MSNGNSLIVSTVVCVSKQAIACDTMEFFTVFNSLPLVGCETGVVCENVEVCTVQRPQWNAGLDSSGTAFTFLGASSNRLIIEGLEVSAAATESFIDIQATYGGQVSITGGVFQGDNFFKAGSRDQKDIDIHVSNVLGATSSRKIGAVSAQANTATTTITTTGVYENLNCNSLFAELASIEEFELNNSTTGEIKYLGNDAFNGNLIATISSVATAGAEKFAFRATVNDVQSNGIAVDQIFTITSSTTLIVPLTLEKDDLVKIQVANLTGINDIKIEYITINIQ